MDGPQDRRGGEVVPFPGGSRHPSQWPVDPGDHPGGGGYCFFCDAPAERDPCPSCGRPLWRSEGEGSRAGTPPPSPGGGRGEGPRSQEEEDPPPTERLESPYEERPTARYEEADPGSGRPGRPDEPPDQEEAGPGAEDDDWDGPELFDYEEEVFTSERYIGATTEEYRGLAEEMLEAAQRSYEPQAVSAPIPGLESGVVGFEDVTGESVPAAAGPSDLPVRIGTGVGLGALFLGALWAGGFWFVALVTAVSVVGLGEFYATLRRRGFVPAALFGLLGAVALMPAAYRGGVAGIAGVTVVVAVVIFLWYALGLVRRSPLENGSLTLLGLVWVPGLLAFAMPMAKAADFRLLVLTAVLVTAAHDTGSYFVGRAWGRTALARRLSPAKTVEGLVGGVLAALSAGLLLVFLDPFQELWQGLAVGAVVAVFAPVGDLAESMVKRSLQVKDMGSVLPGHGGILDRIDGLLFVVPALYVLYWWLGLLA